MCVWGGVRGAVKLRRPPSWWGCALRSTFLAAFLHYNVLKVHKIQNTQSWKCSTCFLYVPWVPIQYVSGLVSLKSIVPQYLSVLNLFNVIMLYWLMTLSNIRATYNWKCLFFYYNILYKWTLWRKYINSRIIFMLWNDNCSKEFYIFCTRMYSGYLEC